MTILTVKEHSLYRRTWLGILMTARLWSYSNSHVYFLFQTKAEDSHIQVGKNLCPQDEGNRVLVSIIN